MLDGGFQYGFVRLDGEAVTTGLQVCLERHDKFCELH